MTEAYRQLGNALARMIASARTTGELAYIGYQDSSGQYITTDPDNPLYVWVRIGGDPRHVARANNIQGVPPDPNMPVRVGIPPGMNELHILGVGEDAALILGGKVPGVVTPHTHEVGAMWDPVSIRRIKAGMVGPKKLAGAYTMSVYINPFMFIHNGSLGQWPGGWLDLTANVPATSGKRRWVLIGVDPATSQAVTINGADYGLPIKLTMDQLAAIDPGGMIPLAGVNLHYGITAIDRDSYFLDARALFESSTTVAAGDVEYTPGASGDWADPDPATVSEALDGLAARATTVALPVTTANVSNPPTAAELDAAIGAPASKGAGYVTLVQDSDTSNVFLVATADAATWHLSALVAAI